MVSPCPKVRTCTLAFRDCSSLGGRWWVGWEVLSGVQQMAGKATPNDHASSLSPPKVGLGCVVLAWMERPISTWAAFILPLPVTGRFLPRLLFSPLGAGGLALSLATQCSHWSVADFMVRPPSQTPEAKVKVLGWPPVCAKQGSATRKHNSGSRMARVSARPLGRPSCNNAVDVYTIC